MFKKKAGTLPKNGGPIGPAISDYKEPERPLRATIEQAKNGFTINCSGGKIGYSDQPHIAESLEKALEVVSKHLGEKVAAKDESKEDKKA